MESDIKDWKLKLRYGQLQTPYSHYTVIADGIAEAVPEVFVCPPGRTFIGMKVWADSAGEAENMIRVIGRDIGFVVTGRIYVYASEPLNPPQENPGAYDITFTPNIPEPEQQ